MKKTQEERESTVTRYIKGSPNYFWDIGVGPKTEYLTLKKIYPDMRCIGLEPREKMFNDLKNKFPGLLLPYAVSDKKGPVELHINNNIEEASGIISSIIRNKKNSYEVPAITLDEIDSYLSQPDNILLWMDIEGAELIALKGGKKILKSGRIKWINLEARDEWCAKRDGVVSIKEIKKYLNNFGYLEVLRYPYPRESGHFDSIFIHMNELNSISLKGLNTTKAHINKINNNYTDLSIEFLNSTLNNNEANKLNTF